MSDTPACLVLIGPDRHRQRQRLQALIRQAGVDPLDQATFDADDERWLDAAREPTARGAKRLVIVERAERVSDAAASWLDAHLPQLAHTAHLILVSDAEPAAKQPLARLVKRVAVERFGWLGPDELGAWIQARVTEAGKRIAAPAVQELIQALGPDLAALERTLDQLVAWLGDRPQISQADCREFLAGRRAAAPAGRDRSPFALVEHIGRRQSFAALRAAAEQLDAGREVLEVLGMVVWQVQRWMLVSRLLQQGTAPARIESMTGVKAWQLDRMRPELASRPVDAIARMLERCRRLDADIKTGRILPRIGLELLIVDLCREGEGTLTSKPERRA